jgi:hypothetical protein
VTCPICRGSGCRYCAAPAYPWWARYPWAEIAIVVAFVVYVLWLASLP